MTSVFGNLQTGMRHMVEPTVTFGTSASSERYNTRDSYRREYSDGQRTAAGVGAGLSVALPAAAGKALVKRGFPTRLPLYDIQFKGAYRTAALVGGGALGLAAMGQGVRQVAWMTKDDANYGAIGATVGVLGGATVGALAAKQLAGHGGKAGMLLGAAAPALGALGLGIAGHAIGAGREIGDGVRNDTEHTARTRSDATAAGRIRNFGETAAVQFIDAGPLTQGFTLGALDRSDSTKSDHAGAQFGDLGATVLAGATAVVATKRILGNSKLAQSAAAMSASERAMVATSGTAIQRMALQFADRPGTIAAAGGIASVIAVASAVNFPLRRTIDDMKASHAANEPDPKVAMTLGASGVVGGMAAGWSLSKNASDVRVPLPDKKVGPIKIKPFTIPKNLIRAGAVAGLGAAGMGLGIGLSAGMGDAKETAVAAGAGIAGGAVLGRAFRGASAKQGAIVGGALGLLASATVAIGD